MRFLSNYIEEQYNTSVCFCKGFAPGMHPLQPKLPPWSASEGPAPKKDSYRLNLYEDLRF